LSKPPTAEGAGINFHVLGVQIRGFHDFGDGSVLPMDLDGCWPIGW
jgi:hypothetical protein